MVQAWKTGEEHWERRRGMRRRLLAVVATLGEEMGSSGWHCA